MKYLVFSIRNSLKDLQKTKYMRILLISPLYNSYIVAPCLGLGYLTSALKKHGHKVLVLDGLREKIEYDPSEWDLVGVTAMSTYFPECSISYFS